MGTALDVKIIPSAIHSKGNDWHDKARLYQIVSRFFLLIKPSILANESESVRVASKVGHGRTVCGSCMKSERSSRTE